MWGLGRGAVAPPQYGVWGYAPRKIVKESTLKLRIFGIFDGLFCSGGNAGLDNRHYKMVQ